MDNDRSFKDYMARLAPLIARRLHAPFSYVGVEPCGKHVILFLDGATQAAVHATPSLLQGRHVLTIQVVHGSATTRDEVMSFRPVGMKDHDAIAFAQVVTRNALRRIP